MFQKSTSFAYYLHSKQPWLLKLRARACSMSCILALIPGIAGAALGEPETSVRGDALRLKASLRTTASAAYTVHELRLPTGTSVLEYVNTSGTIFAVSWRGPSQPDLQDLLGVYFDTYSKAPPSPGSNRSTFGIDQNNLVVRAGGHQRAFFGFAYLPQAMPQGLSAADLR